VRGIVLLSEAGLCCGYAGGPIGDEYMNRYTPVSVGGAFLLGVANVLAAGFVAYLLVRIVETVDDGVRAIRRRRAA
jgi:hypothetical protein